MVQQQKLLFIALTVLLFVSLTESVKFRRHHAKKHHQKSLFTYLKNDSRHHHHSSLSKQSEKLHSLQNFRFKESGTSAMSLPDEEDDGKRGWSKFLIYNGFGDLDLKFFLNPEYHEIQKKPHDQEEEDDHGPIEIPEADMFWFVVNHRGLFALTSRRNDLTKNAMEMSMSEIKPISKQGTVYGGGLEDLGNFKEGFCFKVIQTNDDAWIMCTTNLKEKEEWMLMIFTIKGSAIVVQTRGKRLEGVASLGFDDYNMNAFQYKQTGPNGEEINTEIGRAPVPYLSEWRNLQDWSTCTLKCGGGTQTLHRECVLGSAPEAVPCQGEAILTRPCNEEPCPVEEGDDESEQMPIKVKMYRVSTRPQRFETCIIKEGDMDVIRDDIGNFIRPPRIPSRVVLNNMTFTVFQNVHFDTVVFSTELDDLELTAYPEDESCFVATAVERSEKIKLCSLGTIMGISPKANRDEWVEQIGFFRHNCHKELQLQKPDQDIANIKQREVDEEQHEAEQNAQYGHGPDNSQKMGDVANMAIDALSKETKYEKLAESEEIDREVLQELEARKNLERLKASQECLARDKRKAEAAQREAMSEAQASDEVEALKGNIKSMVMTQRSESSKKIALMKKMADKKKRASQNEIQDIRLTMAKQAMAANKQGDISLCDPKQPAADKTKYCNREFDTDPDLNKDCKDPEQFCMMCCENEMGLKFAAERNKCMKKCNEGPKKGGNWVWVPEANAVKQSS